MKAIKDARSFYASIKNNPLYEQLDDEEIVKILEEEFQFRIEAANAKNMTGWKMKEFLFWQGASLGTLLMAKIFKHHLRAQASEQSIDLQTGERYADKGSN